jgi:5-formyltetrahydrofolate cyclo-ligase
MIINTYTNLKKHEIREKQLAARDKTTVAYRTKADREIILSLSDLPEYKAADVIFCFVGIKTEIDTIPFILEALQSGKRICVPKCIDREIMEAFEIIGVQDLEQGTYGLLEPMKHCRRINPDEIDLAVIPCLAGDRTGHRIGYGYGYYDQYMAGTRYCKVILCRQKFIIEKVPFSENDVIGDIVITEKYICRTQIEGRQ